MNNMQILQIIILMLQIIILAVTIWMIVGLKKLLAEHYKSLVNSHSFGMKLLKVIERQNNEIKNEHSKNVIEIKEEIKKLNEIEELK